MALDKKSMKNYLLNIINADHAPNIFVLDISSRKDMEFMYRFWNKRDYNCNFKYRVIIKYNIL